MESWPSSVHITSSTWYIYMHGLLPFVQTPLGMHHILTQLFSLALSQLHSLYTAYLNTLTTDSYFTLYKLTVIILYIGHYVFFKTVTIRGNEKVNRPFLPPFFTNKGLMPLTWAISNIINLLELWFNLISKINLFLLFHIPMPHQSLIFNYIHVLQDLSIGDLKAKPPDLSYQNSPFKYSPTCHIITGDQSIIDNGNIRKILAKGPKYREPQSINWRTMPENGQSEKKMRLIPFQNGLKLLGH